jgi:hypothetical protein
VGLTLLLARVLGFTSSRHMCSRADHVPVSVPIEPACSAISRAPDSMLPRAACRARRHWRA